MPPKWPDYAVEHKAGDPDHLFSVRTDTGRPKTPVFTVLFTCPPMRDPFVVGGVVLREFYDRAHPNGCPGSQIQHD